MPARRAYKCRQKHYTPPPEIKWESGHVSTSQKTAIIIAKCIEQKCDIKISRDVLKDITNLDHRVQSQIIKEKQVRTFHNRSDNGPETRGRKRALTRRDTAAIGTFVEDDNVKKKDKAALWTDLADMAGVDLPKTKHFKPLGMREVDSQSIQRACKKDENIINAIQHKEKKLPSKQADQRYDFAREQLQERPHSIHWKNVYFCDEFHFDVDFQTIHRIKRKKDRKHRDNLVNAHRKKVTSKNTKTKAREKNAFKLINVFVIVEINYWRSIAYEVSNEVGKMTSKVYIDILN
ncbi:hypothetical protein BDZ45DRAFT_671357 [Acephala macrosclerotiorum]|nr:hypothetical protein BDZ45DRAFT_671357 [Acephala macrosclerotiorum]